MNILKQKLSHSNIPFVLCVPNRPPQPKNAPQLRRMRFWNTQLGSFGKIVGVNMTSLINSETTHQEYIDQMVKSTRANVLDLHVSLFQANRISAGRLYLRLFPLFSSFSNVIFFLN